jgi:hypothetical protein
MNRRAPLKLLSATALLALSACVVTPPRVVLPTVTVAPPPPRVEVIGTPPGHDFFWLPGYWGWQGDRHVWNAGRWEQHRPGEHWVPHRWERDERGGWRMNEGRWHRD